MKPIDRQSRNDVFPPPAAHRIASRVPLPSWYVSRVRAYIWPVVLRGSLSLWQRGVPERSRCEHATVRGEGWWGLGL
jgi:hypothetical protein